MEFDWQLDPIALYAALLSSGILITKIVQWYCNGPKVSVTIINQKEVSRLNRKCPEIIISNIGSYPIVIKSVFISFYTDRLKSKKAGEAHFNHNSAWDPSIAHDPHPTEEGKTTLRVNLINPGSEFHQIIKGFSEYNPSEHWLKAKVTLRNSKSHFIGWAAPVKEGDRE